MHYYSCIFARHHLKDANLSTEIKSTAQLQVMNRFTLIVGYELCSSLNTLYNEEIRNSRSASDAQFIYLRFYNYVSYLSRLCKQRHPIQECEIYQWKQETVTETHTSCYCEIILIISVNILDIDIITTKM